MIHSLQNAEVCIHTIPNKQTNKNTKEVKPTSVPDFKKFEKAFQVIFDT